MHPPLPYQLDAPVFVATGPDMILAFDDIFAESDLLAVLEEVWQPSGIPRSEFLVTIRTDQAAATTTYAATPTSADLLFTDPQLIARLVMHLGKAGFTRTGTIGRDPAGASVSVDFGGILRHQSVPRDWHDAGFRISFPKCRTNARHFYSACLSNCRFPAASATRPRHPNGRRITEEELCILMADRLPVHYGFLDAWISDDGPDGVHPNPTHTIFAAQNILALDWVAGEKMDLDPAFNPVIREAMLRWGTVAIDRRGNQTPWSPWKNATRLGALWAGIFGE